MGDQRPAFRTTERPSRMDRRTVRNAKKSAYMDLQGDCLNAHYSLFAAGRRCVGKGAQEHGK